MLLYNNDVTYKVISIVVKQYENYIILINNNRSINVPIIKIIQHSSEFGIIVLLDRYRICINVPTI